LADFKKWFRARHGLEPESSLTWCGEVSHLYLPDLEARRIDYPVLSDEENDLLVNADLDELVVYASRNGD
jgi:hypothetical protein